MALGSVSGEASSSFLALKDQRMLVVTEGQLPNACGISDAIVQVVN